MNIVPLHVTAFVDGSTCLEEEIECAIGIGILLAITGNADNVASLQGLVQSDCDVIGLNIGLFATDGNLVAYLTLVSTITDSCATGESTLEEREDNSSLCSCAATLYVEGLGAEVQVGIASISHLHDNARLILEESDHTIVDGIVSALYQSSVTSCE